MAAICFIKMAFLMAIFFLASAITAGLGPLPLGDMHLMHLGGRDPGTSCQPGDSAGFAFANGTDLEKASATEANLMANLGQVKDEVEATFRVLVAYCDGAGDGKPATWFILHCFFQDEKTCQRGNTDTCNDYFWYRRARGFVWVNRGF